MHERQKHKPFARFLPYVLITVSVVGWEIIKRTSVFTSPTISQQALRVHGLIAGSVLLIFTCALFARFCLAGRRVVHLYRFEKYLLILLVVDIMALMVGFIRGNAMVFLVGDTYKFSVIPLAYFCTVQTLESEDARKLFLFIVVLETAVTLETFGFYMIRLAMGAYARAPEHSISLFAFIFFMTALTSGIRMSRRKRNIYSILLVIIGLTALLSLARTLWAQIILCPLILLLMGKKTVVIRSLVKPAALALVILIPILLGVSAVYYNVVRELGGRITGTFELLRTSEQISPALSRDRRVVESRAALNQYLESPNFLNFIAGFGNGAEFYAPSAALGMGSRPGYKHHIHNGYISLFFRMGIIGLVSFLLFAFSTLKHIYSVAKQDIYPGTGGLTYFLISRVMFVYFVTTLIEFLTIYSFIGDIKWGVLLGLLGCISPGRELQTENAY